MVLRAAEVEAIDAQIDGLNTVIEETAAAFGYPVFDVNGLFADITSGETVQMFGATTLSADFLTGGIFSYDGLHPQRIGYALLADELIRFLNTEFGNQIPRVDMGSVLFEGDWQSTGVSPRKVKEVVMSKEAFKTLNDLFVPKLERTPRIRRPSTDRSDRPRGDVRRKPASRR
ncbi:MAG: hypothetical protein P8127_11900 [Acidobacteriota bacterium]